MIVSDKINNAVVNVPSSVVKKAFEEDQQDMGNELNLDKARKQARRAKNRRKRDREKARKASKKKWDIPLKWEWVLIVSMISLIGYKVTVNTINSYKLAAFGENQVAYVYGKKNARGTPYRYYRFEVNGKVYKGFSVSDPSFTIGESIMIVYLPSDPSINYSSTYVDKYRAKLRKRQERRQKFVEKFRQ